MLQCGPSWGLVGAGRGRILDAGGMQKVHSQSAQQGKWESAEGLIAD